jgi:Peptidase C10 family
MFRFLDLLRDKDNMRKCLFLSRLFWGRFFIICLFFSGFKLLAAPVDSLKIAQLVDGFLYQNYSGNDVLKIKSIQQMIIEDNKTYLSVVNLYPRGWILVSMDDVAQPVFGYNFEQEFDVKSFGLNPGIQFVIKNNDYSIKKILDSGSTTPDSRWKQQSVRTRSASATTEVTPLIGLSWNQGSGWNKYCPADANGPGGHAYVGCVAVAMAQAMSVYGYPTKGVGSKSYMDANYGQQMVDFTAYGNYNWANILDGSNTPNDDKAALLYHCAVTVQMTFGVGGSGAYVSSVANALKNYFAYSKSTKVIDRVASDDEWISILNNELQNKRPIIYGGDGANGLPGHAFNIDGLSSNGFYHLNWGWSGANNGYFSINNLKPDTYDFTKNQSAVIGVKPLKPGPINISLSNSSVLENFPVGTAVGKIEVEDDLVGNTYTYTITGTYNIDDELKPATFIEENDTIKTKKVFDYVSGKTNKEGMFITVKDKFNNSLTKTIYVDILENLLSALPENKTSDKPAFYNPRNGRVEAVDNQNVEGLRVYSLTGQCVLDFANKSSSYDVSGLVSGAYIAIINTPSGKIRLKFLKY